MSNYIHNLSAQAAAALAQVNYNHNNQREIAALEKRIAELENVLNKAKLSGDYRDLFAQCSLCNGYIGASEEILEDAVHSCDCHIQRGGV